MAPGKDIPVDKNIEKSLNLLQKLESEIQNADAQVEQFKNKLFTPIYTKRRNLLNNIPDFWYIVLAQHEDFQEYISVEDMKYLELITDLFVDFWDNTKIDADDSLPQKGFDITVKFKNSDKSDNKIKEQTIVKKFEWILDLETGSRKLKSDSVRMEWPEQLKSIDPLLIKEKIKTEGRKMTSDEKKKYRQGMRSFFSFFEWTGEKPGKEYRNGEELAMLICDDIFPGALDYYVLAAPGFGENGAGNSDEDEDDDEEDEETGEELDLSDEERDEETPNPKRQKI